MIEKSALVDSEKGELLTAMKVKKTKKGNKLCDTHLSFSSFYVSNTKVCESRQATVPDQKIQGMEMASANLTVLLFGVVHVAR